MRNQLRHDKDLSADTDQLLGSDLNSARPERIRNVSVRVASASWGHRGSRRSSTMGEKSTRKEGGKTAPAKTLKEKRIAKADKRAASSRTENTDAVSRVKNR